MPKKRRQCQNVRCKKLTICKKVAYTSVSETVEYIWLCSPCIDKVMSARLHRRKRKGRLKPSILQGDCLEKLKELPGDSVDSLVTDPPAGIGFMGKEWDKDKGGKNVWVTWMTEVMSETMRVMKPGAHGFVWALPRTSHWTANALEDAGFEVRDVVTHIFGSGFPKNHDVSKALDKLAGVKPIQVTEDRPRNRPDSLIDKQSTIWDKIPGITKPNSDEAKQWSGWGTALKPSNEHWILVRKPIEKKLTVAKNVLKHGTGAINIDASRVSVSENDPNHRSIENKKVHTSTFGSEDGPRLDKNPLRESQISTQGRFPANTMVDESAIEELDEQSLSGGMHSAGKSRIKNVASDYSASSFNLSGERQMNRFGDSGGASRFFYCPKAPKKDKGADNNHPTVKNTKLMSYLIKMVTPPNGVVLDPFMGSGSTGVSAVREGFRFIGIEAEQEYINIAKRRLD